MQVTANGELISLQEGSTLPDLFESLGVSAKWVVAEINGSPINRSDMESTVLYDGDRVELVRAVAGG